MDAVKKRLYLMLAVIAAAVVLAIAGFIILPQTVVVQLAYNGSSGNTMPKLLALAIPFLLATVCAVLYYKDGEAKQLILAVVGLILNIPFYFFNM